MITIKTKRYMKMFGRKGFRFEFEGPFGGSRMRMRRGDIKFLLLEVLKEGPRHGYEIMAAVEERTGYRPSPGSIYPTLQMLEEGGFLTSEDVDGRKVFSVTEAGLKMLDEREAPPEVHPRMKHAFEMKKALMKLGSATMEGVRDGDEDAIKRIAEIIQKARKDVYAVLAES